MCQNVNNAGRIRACLPQKNPLGANKRLISEPDIPISVSLRACNTKCHYMKAQLLKDSYRLTEQ